MATFPPEKTAPQTRRESFIFAIIRGDMEVNETKLANTLGAASLRPATEDEIRLVGAVPGYASPVGLRRAGRISGSSKTSFMVVVDDMVPQSPNLVAGANEAGYHLLNVNYPRDYSADFVADIAAAQDGDACPICASPLQAVRGVEVGNIFKLGTSYSEKLGCLFTDVNGQEKPVIMGSYGIGSGRLLACIAEQHHDEQGLRWPVTVAPYPVHLVALAARGSSETTAFADQLYADLLAAGIEPLYDDRDESPGVKFNDADLIGLPLRLTVSERALKQGGVEMKRRDQSERCIIPLAEVLQAVQSELKQMEMDILAQVREVNYPD